MRTMMTVLVLLTALLAAGCLDLSNSRHVFYLDPDGAVTWTVIQEEVRSGAEDARERATEEQNFLVDASVGEHDVARALDDLGAYWVKSRIVRDSRPYTVVTEARFGSVATAWQEFLSRLVDADAELWWEDDVAHLRIAYRESDDESDPGSDSDDDPVEALLADHEHYRFVLTEGKFIEAEGFRLEADDRAAVMLEPGDEEAEAVFSLAWSYPDSSTDK